MPLFGSDTITPPNSPEGQEDGGAVDNSELFDDAGDDGQLDDQDHGDLDADDADGGEEVIDEEEDGEPSGQEQGDSGLILGKFKTQDDLANAYVNLQREFTRTRQQQPGQQPAAPQQSAGQQPDGDTNELFWDNLNRDPLGTLTYLIENAVAQRTAPIYEQRNTEILAKNLSSVAGEYTQLRTEDGLRQVFERVGEIAQEFGRPELAKNPTPRILRMAAEEVFGSTKAQVYRQAKQEARQEVANTRRAKQGAAIPTGTKPRSNEPARSEEEQIADDIVSAGRGFTLFGGR